MTTRELFEFVWPRLDSSKWRPEWRWLRVREAAERYAIRVGRSRPLLWKAKPDVVPDE
jgi:hypothetical protein